MANPTVRIIIDGDAKKYIRALKHVEQDTDSFRSKIGAGLGKAAKTGGLIAGAAIAGVGAAAVSAAKDQDEANSIIQRATGRTGEALTALQDQSQQIFRSTNAAQEAIAGTIGTVDTLFDGTAEQVGAMTLSIESFSDVVGGDMVQNASDLGKVANIFGEDIGGAHESLDALTAVSQGYDIEGGELLKVLQKQGKNFAALGLDIGSSAVAMGKLNAAGIDIRSMGSGIERFIGIAVEAGQDPADAFRQLEADIRNAATAEEALAVATDALGDKAGVQLANAIGQGVEIMGDFTGEVEASAGQLELMAAESETVGEKFQRMQNNITGALADVGAPILDALMPIIDIVTNDLMPAIEPALKTIADLFGQLAPAVGPIVKALADALVPIIDTLVQVLVPVLVPVLGLVGELMADLAPIVGMVVTSIGRLLIPSNRDADAAVVGGRPGADGRSVAGSRGTMAGHRIVARTGPRGADGRTQAHPRHPVPVDQTSGRRGRRRAVLVHQNRCQPCHRVLVGEDRRTRRVAGREPDADHRDRLRLAAGQAHSRVGDPDRRYRLGHRESPISYRLVPRPLGQTQRDDLGRNMGQPQEQRSATPSTQ